MVQLNTTYDSSIHQKIFVLRGDEAYARTTDTIATLITDFDNYSTYISKCHVGLEIQVLRELGESTLHIYCDDEEIYAIPWVDSGMAQVIDSDWNDKGVYWEDGKLIIGKYDYENHINTGLFLLYDVEHTITIRYDGNKRCLGSKADPIIFTVPTPDTFATELTFNKENPRYAPYSTIDDVTLTLTCQNELTSSKMIDIYDDSTTPSTLLDTVELEQDTPLTVTLSGLSDGLHNIRASWNGDYECYGSETTMNMSIGYKITQLEYPSVLVTGEKGRVYCFILDYFDNPWKNKEFKLYEEINSAWHYMGKTESTDRDGQIKFHNVSISSHPYALFDEDLIMSSEIMTTEIIDVSDIQVAFSNPITESSLSRYGDWSIATNRITAIPIGQNNQPIQVADIPLTIKLESYRPTETFSGYTKSDGTYYRDLSTNTPRIITATVTVKNTEISNTAKWIVPEYWWSSSNNKQAGSYTADGGINITKVNNGFKFDYQGSPAKNVYFGYGSNTGVYVIEFDGISANSYQYPSQVYVCGREFGIGRSHLKFVHDIDNGTVQAYLDGRTGASWSYSEKRFHLGVMNYNFVIDNLVIVREE